jgi:hypothetical protein
MFGKRSTGGAAAPALAVRAPTPAAPVQRQPEPQAADPRRPAPVAAPEPQRSEEYYQMKSMIFGALIEAIDLSQLAKLDGESAREEIRDIINEIISLKNLATVRSSRFWRATTSLTSWSTAPPGPSSKPAARSPSPTSASATTRS